MKGLPMTRVIAILAGLAVVTAAGASQAQLIEGKNLLTGNVSYVLAKVADTDETVDGAGLGIFFEKAHDRARWSLGFGFSIQKAEYSFTKEGTDFRALYSNFDASLRVRFYAVPEARVTPYGGLGLGMRFSGVSLNTVDDDVSDSANGASLTVPLGVMFFISSNVCLDASYTFNFLGNSRFIANNIQHLFSLGIGLSGF
jgi:opacity protein-like surface antigen